ncbi:MAG: aminodeoxychorismate synthase component I [Gemmatimonadota bacterium]|nr:aminodeoxychorismate synthase component I [Gemmatimonadota bacterium]
MRLQRTGPGRLAVRGGPEPSEVFRGLAGRPGALWLDSSLPGGSAGRRSFIAADPFAVLTCRDGRCHLAGAAGAFPVEGPPFDALHRLLVRWPGDPGDTFAGGAAGFLGYELLRELEDVPPARDRDLDVPDLEIAFYDLVLGWDHAAGSAWIASTGQPERGAAAHRRREERLAAGAAWLRGEAPSGADPGRRPSPDALATPPPGAPTGRPGLAASFDRPGYEAAVREAIERIRAGDIFQVNLAQRFVAPAAPDPLAFHLALRERSPAPFGAFFRGHDAVVVSASPERFLRVDAAGRVEARPIKGTRPRGDTPARDRALAAELTASAKDRAENLMIVDLVRNDLSRVCRPGTVRPRKIFQLESYATVHHLVSVIEGRLRPGTGIVDLLRAAFPCGSVTGAPKPRAMEIISELEPVRRGPAYGAMGWFGGPGTADLSVAIRTAVLSGGRATFHVGGAVVADSDPAAEYRETLDKGRALAAALGTDELQ